MPAAQPADRHIQAPAEAIGPSTELLENKPIATLLVVDDDEMTRDFLVRFLERKGYAVIPAASGEDALEKWKTLDALPQLLIADLCMPGMGGRETACVLRHLQPGLKVLFISGSGYELMQEALLAVRDSRHLFKPFRIDQLIDAVKAILV